MNTRNILPLTSFVPGIGNITVDKLMLKDFHHYFFDGGNGMVSYSLQDSLTLIEHFSNNIEIPSTVMQQWGASDDIIFEYVANQLNLTIIN